MGLTRTRAATQSPLNASEVREHLRGSEQPDGYLVALANVATEYAENYTGRTLLTSTCVLTLERFAETIRLPGSPVSSVTSIEYVGTDGVEQTLSDSLYRVTTYSEPVRITRAYNASWPTPRNITEAITVTYAAGYGDTLASAPEAIRQAVLLLIEYLHDPDAKITQQQAERVLDQYRLGAFAAFGGLDNSCALGITNTA